MSRENVETLRQLYDALGRRGQPGAIDFFDPDVVLINTAESPETAPYVGHDGIARWLRTAVEALSGLRIEADETIDVDESRVLVVGRICGEGRASGLPVEVPVSTVYTLRDGLIVRMQAYVTKAEALEAVGLEG